MTETANYNLFGTGDEHSPFNFVPDGATGDPKDAHEMPPEKLGCDDRKSAPANELGEEPEMYGVS